MAEQQGGYRRPNKPAPVSGPTSMSRRTDDGRKQAVRYMAGGQYGEGKKILEQQQGAPMAGKPSNPVIRQPVNRTPIMVPEEPVVGLFAPTQRPNEPISYGSDFGPGPGSEIIDRRTQSPNIFEIMEQLIQADPTGESQLIYTFLSDENF